MEVWEVWKKCPLVKRCPLVPEKRCHLVPKH
jgi:hypothetical protein